MIPELQRTYVLELLTALGDAADDFVVAGAQAMKFSVAKARGTKLGGRNAQSELAEREARERAERLRPIFAELTGLSAHKAADELNRRGIATPKGGKWYAATVIRVRERLA